MPRARLAGLALGALLASLPGGCRSAQEQRDAADRDVYRLIEDRRALLALGEADFTIEPRADRLRSRLVSGEVRELEPLSIAECLEIGAENSRDYQSRKERLYLAALDLTLERWRFTVQESGSLAAALDGTGDEAELATAGAGAGITRLLGSGALIVGDIGLNLARSLTSSEGWNPISAVGFSITQPLLRGFGARIVREPLTQAERSLVYEVRAFERYRRSFAVDVAERYYRVLQTEDAVKNQETNYANLQRLTARNEELARAGRLSDIEFGQAQQNELRSRVNLLSAIARLEQQRDAFKFFLGLPIEAGLPLDPTVFADLGGEDLGDLEALEEPAVIGFALENRLDHLTALDQVDDAARRIEVAADALRGALDVGAEATLASTPDKPLEFDLGDTQWSLGLTYDLAVDRLPQRNAYRRAWITHEVAGRAAEQSGDEIRAELRDELRETETRREGYRIQLAAVELAERRIESTRLKLEAGRADTRDLLEAEESLLQARNGATEALIDYTLARLALFRDMELLRLGPDGIEIEEELLLDRMEAGQEGGSEDGAESPAPPAGREEGP